MARYLAFVSGAAVLAVAGLIPGAVTSTARGTGGAKTYVVVFKGGYAVDGTYAVDSTYAVLCSYAVGGSYAVTGQYAVSCNYAVTPVASVYAVAERYAVGLVGAAGGTVANNILKQTGMLIVESANSTFAQTMRNYAVVDAVAEDYKWKAFHSYDEAIRTGALTLVSPSSVPGGGPEPTEDPLEPLQWSMKNINAPQAHEIQTSASARTT